uniref:Uncharacterized protein n=1 Tax=Tetranychus urticae TaxID=32264 RepID=T1K9N0_TETUR
MQNLVMMMIPKCDWNRSSFWVIKLVVRLTTETLFLYKWL